MPCTTRKDLLKQIKEMKAGNQHLQAALADRVNQCRALQAENARLYQTIKARVEPELVSSGNVTDLYIDGFNRLIIRHNGTLDSSDIQDLQERPSDHVLHDLLEYHLCNGWRMVAPEEIGALTDAPIITNEWDEDDQGKLLSVGSVWWFPGYMISDPVEHIFTDTGAVFENADH